MGLVCLAAHQKISEPERQHSDALSGKLDDFEHMPQNHVSHRNRENTNKKSMPMACFFPSSGI